MNTINTSVQRRLGLGPIGDALFIVLVVVDFVFVLTLPQGLLDLGSVAILALASLAYILMGVYGWRYWEVSRSDRAALAYFAIQIALGAFIVYWGYGNAWLLLLPLASQSIELPRRGTLGVGALLVLSIALPTLAPGRLLASGLVRPEEISSTGVWASAEFAMAVLFVLLFSELVVRERLARADIFRGRGGAGDEGSGGISLHARGLRIHFVAGGRQQESQHGQPERGSQYERHATVLSRQMFALQGGH